MISKNVSVMNYWNSQLIFINVYVITKVKTITSNSFLFSNFNDY